MASAMIKPTMQNAIMMEATVVGLALIWSNALNVGVWMDPPQIIYVSEMIRRAHTFLIKSFQNTYLIPTPPISKIITMKNARA